MSHFISTYNVNAQPLCYQVSVLFQKDELILGQEIFII